MLLLWNRAVQKELPNQFDLEHPSTHVNRFEWRRRGWNIANRDSLIMLNWTLIDYQENTRMFGCV